MDFWLGRNLAITPLELGSLNQGRLGLPFRRRSSPQQPQPSPVSHSPIVESPQKKPLVIEAPPPLQPSIQSVDISPVSTYPQSINANSSSFQKLWKKAHEMASASSSKVAFLVGVGTSYHAYTLDETADVIYNHLNGNIIGSINKKSFLFPKNLNPASVIASTSQYRKHYIEKYKQFYKTQELDWGTSTTYPAPSLRMIKEFLIDLSSGNYIPNLVTSTWYSFNIGNQTITIISVNKSTPTVKID